MRAFFLSNPLVLRLSVWGVFIAIMLAVAAIGSASVQSFGRWPVIVFIACAIGVAFIYERRHR